MRIALMKWKSGGRAVARGKFGEYGNSPRIENEQGRRCLIRWMDG